MKTFDTIEEYLMEGKIGDRITLEDFGQLNRMFPSTKHDVLKVVDIFRGEITVTQFRGKTRQRIEKEQKVGLLSNNEFKSFRTLW
jgi:hypothetical protein